MAASLTAARAPALQLQPPVIELLQREEADLLRLVLRQERFLADDVEVARKILDAARALPRAMVGLDELQPSFDAPVVEGGADRPVLLEFEVAVARMAGARTDRLDEAAARPDLGAAVEPILLEVEARRLLLLARTDRIADRYAVDAVIMAVGEAEMACIGDDRGAHARGPRPAERVGQPAGQRGVAREIDGFVRVFRVGGGQGGGRQRLLPRAARQDVTADLEIVALAIAPVGMDDETSPIAASAAPAPERSFAAEP